MSECETTSNECLKVGCDSCGGPIVVGSRILLSRAEIRLWGKRDVRELLNIKADLVRAAVYEGAIEELSKRGWEAS